MRATGSAVRPLAILTATLLVTAFSAPAFAQIEEVIVTAQKRAEDVQTVPIAITAYTAQDLAAHQVDQFKDIQFSTPNVSYTKGNFSGADFQIRGIGITAVGYDAESGVAINFDDVYLNAPPLAEASFYDLDSIQVLRGPQSTLYGRGATGGTVNVFSAKPQLDAFGGDVEASYGNYNAWETKGAVNIPLVTDQLGVRIAGDWLSRDGFTTNIFNGSHPDDRSQYSFRGSLRWQPSQNTTIDLVAQYGHENDTRMRAQKQLCTTDPSGTLGCLPDSLQAQPVNINATLASAVVSRQGFYSQGFNIGLLGASLAGVTDPAQLFAAGNQVGNIFAPMGLIDLTQAPTLPPGFVDPSDPRKINTDYNPTYKAQDMFLSGEWKQSLGDWLDGTLVLGYDRNGVRSNESYNNIPGSPFDPATLAASEAAIPQALTALLIGNGVPVNDALAFAKAYSAPYQQMYFSHPGELPISQIGGLGISTGNMRFTNTNTAVDQSDNYNKEWSGELRFNSKFQGPVNFMLAGYYLKTENTGDYYVDFDADDYAGIALGNVLGPTVAPLLGFTQCAAAPCLASPTYYHNDGRYNRLTSKSIFGEVYWDAIPDELKVTLGARWTEDEKFQQGRIVLLNAGFAPIGAGDEDAQVAAAAAIPFSPALGCQYDADPTTPTVCDAWQYQNVTYKKWTGRAVVDWTPKVDFTDATLVYASYARGYKAGGFNPGIETGLLVPSTYAPESIDAYELGTKNTLLNGTLQANADIWYYDYKDLQVSEILGNTSVNQNVSAKLWGVEGEFLWAPTERWQFNLSAANTHSDIGSERLLDVRNPTDGRADVVLIKDATQGATAGSNCVLYYTGSGPTPSPADLGVPGFFDPPGGANVIANHGVAVANYGSCAPNAFQQAALTAAGFSTQDPQNPQIANASLGVGKNLSGNKLQNTPDWTISIGAQYTQPLDNDYNLVGRVDFYWQSSMWGTIFNDPADKIKSWEVTNAQLTLNAPDNRWYVQGFVKNVFNEDNMTGMYVTNSASALYTNVFYGDPRTYGIAVGARF